MFFCVVGRSIWGLTSHQQLRLYGDGTPVYHPKDWRSPGSNLQPLVYNASDITTVPWRLFFCVVV